MTAFPSLTAGERAGFARLGVDPDDSLLRWLTVLTGRDRALELMTVEPDPETDVLDLTDLEREVLRLHDDGLPIATVADRLGVLPTTAKRMRRNARAKLRLPPLASPLPMP